MFSLVCPWGMGCLPLVRGVWVCVSVAETHSGSCRGCDKHTSVRHTPADIPHWQTPHCRPPQWQTPPGHTSPGRLSTSGRYAFHWNAFLWCICFWGNFTLRVDFFTSRAEPTRSLDSGGSKGRPTTAQFYFNFMQFFAKFYKIICRRPH